MMRTGHEDIDTHLESKPWDEEGLERLGLKMRARGCGLGSMLELEVVFWDVLFQHPHSEAQISERIVEMVWLLTEFQMPSRRQTLPKTSLRRAQKGICP
jgi:hypothetical protein